MRQHMAQLEIEEAERTEREWRRALGPGLRAQLARERGMPVQRIPKPADRSDGSRLVDQLQIKVIR